MRAWILAITTGILGGAVMVAVVQVVQSLLVKGITSRGPAAAVATRTLGDFGLDHRFRHRPRELSVGSGGEAMPTLGSEPEILLADGLQRLERDRPGDPGSAQTATRIGAHHRRSRELGRGLRGPDRCRGRRGGGAGSTPA